MNKWQSQSDSRAGAAVTECVAAIALLAVMAVVLAPFISRLGQLRADLLRRQLAQVELRNLAEIALASPPDQQPALTPETEQRLPQARLEVTQQETSSNDAKQRQVTLALSWLNSAGERVSPLQLSFWRPVPETAP